MNRQTKIELTIQLRVVIQPIIAKAAARSRKRFPWRGYRVALALFGKPSVTGSLTVLYVPPRFWRSTVR